MCRASPRISKTSNSASRLRRQPALPYKRAMAETTYFPRRLILAGAMISGVLLALAVHMLGARYGLDLGGLWRSDTREFMPAGAAIAWWLIATVGFSGGYFTATLMDSAVSGQIPQRMRQFLIAVGVLVLAGAGQAASAPSPIPTISGVLAGLAALVPRPARAADSGRRRGGQDLWSTEGRHSNGAHAGQGNITPAMIRARWTSARRAVAVAALFGSLRRPGLGAVVPRRGDEDLDVRETVVVTGPVSPDALGSVGRTW